MNTNKNTPTDPKNTLAFVDFAPYRLICRCASCVHRKNSKVTDAEGSVILCAKSRPVICAGCPYAGPNA